MYVLPCISQGVLTHADVWSGANNANDNFFPPLYLAIFVLLSTWEYPNVAAKEQLQPPSSPSKQHAREADQCRKGADALWHHMETGASQRNIIFPV